ncbi:MAG: hypothetical protein WAL90_12170, partial [Desulfobacterales bacterium]
IKPPGAVAPVGPFSPWTVSQPVKHNPNIAKVGGLQSQGVKGEAVNTYRNPLTTRDLKSSGFPSG